MGKYRRYARKKRARRKLSKLLLPIAIAIAFLYTAMTMTLVIPLQNDFLRYALLGDRVVNVTLLRATYIASPEDRNYTVLVTVGSETLEFNIPKGSERKTFLLRESKLVRVSEEVVNTFFRVADSLVGVPYPGPYLNLTKVGRSEDYILSQYPLEVYFILSTQICNASLRAEYSGISLGSIRVEYREWEEGPIKLSELACSGGSCIGTLTKRCVFSYGVSAEPTIAGVLRLRYENRRTYLRLADNPWIAAVLYIATILPLLVYVRKREAATPT